MKYNGIYAQEQNGQVVAINLSEHRLTKFNSVAEFKKTFYNPDNEFWKTDLNYY